MEITLTDQDLVLEKLYRLKCQQGCNGFANYIVFEMGVYCTTCLSKLQDVPSTHLATFEDLSNIITELVHQYKKTNKNQNNLAVLKAQIEQQGTLLKTYRDRVTLDAKAIQSQASNIITNTRNQPLQSFFENDITHSLKMNESELFIKNLKNLRAVESESRVNYIFEQISKNPTLVKDNSLRQIERVAKAIDVAHEKARCIMNRFRDATKQ